MKHIVRPAVLIVAAMVGSAVVLVALIGAAKSLSVFASTPADFLPASETTLIAYQPTDSMQKRWQLQSDEAVALLELESGTKGFVEFTADPTAATKRIGIFGVNVSDPLLAPSVATQANPLDKEDAYRRIENIVPKKTSWAYLSTALLHEPQAIGQRILRPALLRKASRIGYSEDTNDVHIYRLETNRPWRTTALTIPEVRNAFFVMSYGNASQAWDSVKTVLQKNDAAVLEGLLRSYAGKFGAVSFDHEILPLMEQPGSLQFTQTGGSVHVLLSGTHEDKTELNTIIEHLHASYAVTLPTTRVTHRVLDQRFSSTDLRHDESVIVQSDENIGNFWVSETRHTDQQNGLFTAMSENAFFITTNKQILLHALSHESPISSDERTGTRTIEISLDPVQAANALQSTMEPESRILGALGTGPLFFFSEWKADVQSHTIRLPENASQLLDYLF